MTYRFIAVADIHMSNKLPYARPIERGMTDRLIDQLALWELIKRTAEESKANALFVLGDLFDKSVVDAVTLTHTVEPIVGLGIPVFILPGNHDANSIHGGRFTSEVFRAMGKSDVVFMDGSESIAVTYDTDFWPIPFCPAGEAERLIAEARAKLDKTNKNVLLLHHSIEGCSHLGWVCDDGLDPAKVCDGFDLVLAGHFHTSQDFGDCGLYLGAPMHHHFGDAGRDSQFWVIDIEDDGFEMTPVKTAAPCFHLVSEAKRVKAAKPKRGDYLRYEVECTKADWVKRKAEAEALVAEWRKKGIRASYKHKPIYHHEARMASDDGHGSPAPLVEMIEQYPEAVGVAVGDLDVKRLKRIGREALEAVRKADALS